MFVIIGALVAALGSAKDIHLLENGEATPFYGEKISMVEEGDRLIFELEDGRQASFEVAEIVRQPKNGGFTLVYRDGEGTVRRTPYPSRNNSEDSVRKAVQMGHRFVEGVRQKESHQGGPVVREYPEKSLVPWAVAVEDLGDVILHEDITNRWNDAYAKMGETFRSIPVGDLTISRDQYLGDLVNFAATFAAFSGDGDFNAGQLGWIPGRGIVWFDFGGKARIAESLDDRHLFSKGVEIPKGMREPIVQAIYEARRAQGLVNADPCDLGGRDLHYY